MSAISILVMVLLSVGRIPTSHASSFSPSNNGAHNSKVPRTAAATSDPDKSPKSTTTSKQTCSLKSIDAVAAATAPDPLNNDKSTTDTKKEKKEKKVSVTPSTIEIASTLSETKKRKKKNSKKKSKKKDKQQQIQQSQELASAKSMSKPKKTLARSDTARRIQREWKDLVEAGMGFDWSKGRPVRTKKSKAAGDLQSQHIWIGPLSMHNLYIWHFSFLGVEGSPYQNGIYHGRMVLPKNYPASPPQVQVWTPSGRFVVRSNICLSASSYHPETWTASWTIRTLTQALRLHMITNANEIGGISSCSYEERVEYAREAQNWQAHIRYGDTAANRAMFVNHVDMVRQGLFPLLSNDDSEANAEKETEVEIINQNDRADPGGSSDVAEGSKREQTKDPHDLESFMEAMVERKIRLAEIQQEQRKQLSSSPLEQMVKSRLRLVLWGFLIMFLLLNRM